MKKPVNKRRAVPDQYVYKEAVANGIGRYPEKMYKLQPREDDPIPSHGRCRREESVLCRRQICHTF